METLREYIRDIKTRIGEYSDAIFIFVIVFLGAMTVLGLIIRQQQPKFEPTTQNMELSQVQNNATATHAIIVGNKNSKIYHLSDCPGALKLSEANKIIFDSVAMAVSAGYRPAKNCPGLEYLK